MSKLIRYILDVSNFIIVNFQVGMSPEQYFPANFCTMAQTFLIDVQLLILETKLCHDLFAHFMVHLALARIILYFSIFSVVGDVFTLCRAFFLSMMAVLQRGQTEHHLVALYDIRPRNGAGLFLQPRSPCGASHE